MNKTVSIPAFVVLLVLLQALTALSAPRSKEIAVANAGGLDEEQAAALVSFLQSSLGVEVRLFTHNKPKIRKAVLFALTESVRKVLTEKDECVVILSDLEGLVDSVVVSPDSRWAIVNTAALRANADGAKMLARTKKQAMRSVGFLFGIPYSLDPKCVQRPCPGLAALDKMGMTYTAPALAAFQMNAAQKGIGVPAARSIRWRKKHGKAPEKDTTK